MADENATPDTPAENPAPAPAPDPDTFPLTRKEGRKILEAVDARMRETETRLRERSDPTAAPVVKPEEFLGILGF